MKSQKEHIANGALTSTRSTFQRRQAISGGRHCIPVGLACQNYYFFSF